MADPRLDRGCGAVARAQSFACRRISVQAAAAGSSLADVDRDVSLEKPPLLVEVIDVELGWANGFALQKAAL